MNAHGNTGRLPAEAFFLSAEEGKRFCIFHAPQPDKPYRGTLLYVHPFGDEMNRSRRMAAMQARQFSDAGYGVLLIDLYGCGDSSGDFAEATWERWKTDLALAKKWLEERVSGPVGLWGLRLGALLALDFAADSGRAMPSEIATLILWKPVLDGKAFMTQFLRLHLASEMLAGEAKTTGTRELREALAAGRTLEIGGYAITSALSLAIDALDAKTLAPVAMPVHWFDIIGDTGSGAAPAVVAAAETWRLKNTALHLTTVVGLPFWTTPELSICPELLHATSDAMLHHSMAPA
jgi:exosortase A-associated hydrolase 2